MCSVYFLLLFVCCQLCGQGCGASSLPVQKNPEGSTISDFLKLNGKQIEYEFGPTGTKGGNKITEVKNIGSVFLVANKDFLVALAEVNSNVDTNNEKINVLAKSLKIKEKNVSEVAFNSNGSGWKTQLVTQTPTDLKDKNKVKSFAVVVNSNKIYYFLVTGTTVAGGDSTDNSKLEITVIVGEIDSDNPENEAMKWETLDSSKLTNVGDLNKKLKIAPDKIPPVFGFGFANGDKVVFAIQGEGKEENENKGKNVTAFIQLDKQANKLEFLYEENTENCYCSLFLWKEQIVMVPSVCTPDSEQKIRVLDYKKEIKKNNDKAVNFLKEFLKDKKNFFTIKINSSTDVLFFTQQTEEHTVYLWMTDGKRTAKVGIIIAGSKDNIDVSILHINNELFVLYEQQTSSGGDAIDKYDLKRLPELSTKTESILKAWKNTDNEIKMLFKETAITENFFTDDLVGFLTGIDGNSEIEWADRYSYVNADVKKGTKDGQGFKFNGAESGAEWHVGKAKSEQPYNFTNPGFTLLATVTVEDGTSSNYNSILGVSLKGLNNHVGLWCAKEGMWGVGDVKSTTKGTVSAKECTTEKIYQVALVYKDNKISVYIDWELLGGEQNFEISEENQEKLQFYFGAHTAQNNVESHVTVTNVLLYNRPFEQGQIDELRKKVKTTEETKRPDTESKDTNTTGKQGGNEQPPTPLPKISEEKAPSPSRTEDGGVAGSVRVFSLLLAVLCVSAPLLHL